jgi:hypothetical protein
MAFKELFLVLRNNNLFADGPSAKIDLSDNKAVNEAIAAATPKLPALYYDSYIAPLQKNLDFVMKRESTATLETLAGAVYDHRHQDREVRRSLKSFLAVISNLYRSFMEPEPTAKHRFPVPSPQMLIPPLATFRPVLNKKNHEFGPFALPADEVGKLCGAHVGVVSLPSCYRNHPALCWGAIAHETGGHHVLHAWDGLLWELRHGVRTLFHRGSDPKGREPESKEQYLGLLWQFWAEEAASDVCALLNLGPAYGIGLAIYMAALNEAIFYFKTGVRGEHPILTVSWPPANAEDIYWVDSHPTDVLKLNVMIGAIECLPLSDKEKKQYISDIRNCIEVSLEAGRVRAQYNDIITISGQLVFKPGKLMSVTEEFHRAHRITREEMEGYARQVGRFIASETFSALNGNSLQDLETWDGADEAIARNIKYRLLRELPDPTEEFLGDDAQLLSGTLLAIYEAPRGYRALNDWLCEALAASFRFDPIWGQPIWYPIAGSSVYPQALIKAKTS